MLIGLGFKPLAAAGLALIGNTAPVAFGALGTPVITLATVTGLPVEKLSAMVGRQLPFFSVLVPFWLVWAMAGLHGMAEVWPACLVAGVFFAVPQYYVSNHIGPGAGRHHRGSIVSIVAVLRPPAVLAAEEDLALRGVEARAAKTAARPRPSPRPAVKAWMPWLSSRSSSSSGATGVKAS